MALSSFPTSSLLSFMWGTTEVTFLGPLLPLALTTVSFHLCIPCAPSLYLSAIWYSYVSQSDSQHLWQWLNNSRALSEHMLRASGKWSPVNLREGVYLTKYWQCQVHGENLIDVCWWNEWVLGDYKWNYFLFTVTLPSHCHSSLSTIWTCLSHLLKYNIYYIHICIYVILRIKALRGLGK